MEVSNIWVLFVLYFRLLGYITCNVAGMKARLRDLQRFYKHINEKELFPLNGITTQKFHSSKATTNPSAS